MDDKLNSFLSSLDLFSLGDFLYLHPVKGFVALFLGPVLLWLYVKSLISVLFLDRKE